MKKKFQLIFLAALSFLGCAHEIPLSYKDTANFKVSNISTKTEKILEISGLSFHSAYAVNRINVKHENEAAVIEIFLTLAKNKQTGAFSFQVEFPNSIKEVYFGEEKKLVYKFD